MTEELLNIFEENRKTPLEDKINQTKDQPNSIASPPPPTPTTTIKKVNPENPSRAVINELRNLFEKRKQMKDEK